MVPGTKAAPFSINGERLCCLFRLLFPSTIFSPFNDCPQHESISSQVVRAFSAVYDLGLSIREEMEIAYQGEILTPSKCGEWYCMGR
jgi:hypothetical protein